MDPKLNPPKPCPFCGADLVETYGGSTFRWMYAGCAECGAQAGEVRVQTLGDGDKEQWLAAARADALAEWNRRAYKE